MSRRHAMRAAAPLSRRDFLRVGGAAGVVAGLEGLRPAGARRPAPVVDGGAAGVRPNADGSIDLRIARTGIRVGSRRGTATTINGTVPGPLLRFREGDDAVIRVTNELDHHTSIHWHGVLLPNAMDGVPGVTFPGIMAGETFTYRFPIRQYGTYWYHSHSAFQEQLGHYGPLVFDPAGGEPFAFDREFVIVLSDWTFEDPAAVMAKLKKQGSYYNFQRRTILDFFRDVAGDGLGATIRNRLDWGRMRMSPTDISDITGATYTYLMNGFAPESDWTALFRPGERVRLRFINAAAGSYFDVRVPGLEHHGRPGQRPARAAGEDGRVPHRDSRDVRRARRAGRRPRLHHLRRGNGPDRLRARHAHATRGAHARSPAAARPAAAHHVRHGHGAQQHARRWPRHGGDGGNAGHARRENGRHAGNGNADGYGRGRRSCRPRRHAGMPGHEHAGHDGPCARDRDRVAPPGTVPEPVMHGPTHHGAGNAAVPMMTRSRLEEPGIGLGEDGRRVLVYTQLRALHARPELRAPDREIEIHLTGNMERFMWSMDGMKFSDAGPIEVTLGERIRLTMVNDTMMQHPMHLHGMWMELENGRGRGDPARAHDQRQARRAPVAALHGGRGRAVGVPLPHPLSHGSRHVSRRPRPARRSGRSGSGAMRATTHTRRRAARTISAPALLVTLAAAALLAPSAAAAQVMDEQIHAYVLFDRFEYAPGAAGAPLLLDATSWIGGDYDRLWLQAESDYATVGDARDFELRASYGRLVAPFWDALAGMRIHHARGEDGGRTRGLLGVGLTGLAPYWFEVNAAAFISQAGDVSARLSAEYEVLFTQRLIAQPRVELNAAVQEVPEFGVGRGLNDLDLGLRLRYEIEREFAPYVGFAWVRRVGGAAALARAAGEGIGGFSLLAGVRAWR